MDRKEVVKQIGLLETNHCRECTRLVGLHQTKRENICLYECEIGKKLAELGQELGGAPSNKKHVKKTIGANWTEDEIKLLYSDKSTPEVAIILGRTISSVTSKRRRVRGKRGEGASSDV